MPIKPALYGTVLSVRIVIEITVNPVLKIREVSMNFLVYCLIIIASLSVSLEVVTKHSVDEKLIPLVNEFQFVTDTVCKKSQLFYPNVTTIQFGDLPPGIIGLCVYTPFYYTITIDRNYYRNAWPDNRMSVVWHELSHCVLGLGHSNDPYNYMYTNINESLTRQDVQDQLIYNLKEKCGGH